MRLSSAVFALVNRWLMIAMEDGADSKIARGERENRIWRGMENERGGQRWTEHLYGVRERRRLLITDSWRKEEHR